MVPRTALIALMLSAAALGGCNEAAKVGLETPRPLLISVTSGVENPHAVTMALQLAGHGLADGRAVLLFFNVRGAAIPTKTLDATLAHGDRPIRQLLADRLAEGATVLVCPHCMKAMGVSADDLVAGAQVADAKKLFAGVDDGAAVFTY